MHLGLTDRSFVPHNLISTQERPVPFFFTVPDAPPPSTRLKILMSSGFKKGTQIYFFFFSKIPTNEAPPGPPTWPVWREIPVYRAFCVSLDDLVKIPVNKKALRKERPTTFPKSGSPIEADAHIRALINISVGVTSKGALP